MYHPSYNVAIEEEFQIVDPQSRELLGFVSQSMAGDRTTMQERNADFEFIQEANSAVMEVGTPVCADITEARQHLLRIRRTLLELAAARGFKVMAAGTHPFSRWEKVSSLAPRYQAMVEESQMIARRMLAFGLHVHIGVEDRELAIDVMNTIRYVLPHILTLSTSSPFWAGRNTGLKSYRTVLLDALPRTGMPGYFSSYQEYRSYVDTLVRTNCIPNASKIWYDVLPHYRFPTLAFRICDMVPNYRDALAIAALLQATVAWMVDLRQRNMSFRIYERLLINENKWRAVRYGLEGRLIDFGIEQEAPVRDLISELLERIWPIGAKLNIEEELEHAAAILARGACADQQLRVWRESNEDYASVVDFLIKEMEDIA